MKASSYGDFGCALHFEDSYFERQRVAARCVDCVKCGKPSRAVTKGGFVLCCCVVHRSKEFIVVIALLVLVVSFCEAASVSESFCCVLSCTKAYSRSYGHEY